MYKENYICRNRTLFLLGVWMLCLLFSVSSHAKKDKDNDSLPDPNNYQELTPVSVYSNINGDIYIVTEQNVGTNGCTLDAASVVIKVKEQSEDFAKSALSISLAAIASNKSISVYWGGCLKDGRPKVAFIGFGSNQIN